MSIAASVIFASISKKKGNPDPPIYVHLISPSVPVMRSIFINFSLFLLLVVASSASVPSLDFHSGRLNNVCKDLRNDVLLYFVFVDTRTTYPWSEFDILTTIDSIQVAARWLEKEAEKHAIPLHIKTDYYIGDEYTTIQRNLPGKSLKVILESQKLFKGMSALSRWGDYISKTIGESLYVKEKDGIPLQKNPGNKERLMAFLRDEYRVESVALMIMINNYFGSDISLAVNSLHNDDVEFSVISYKYPTDIAHNFLHLFGAVDLHETPFRRSKRKIRLADEAFPDDIMSGVHTRSIHELEIGAFTEYMIGWTEELDGTYEPLLTERFSLLR